MRQNSWNVCSPLSLFDCREMRNSWAKLATPAMCLYVLFVDACLPNLFSLECEILNVAVTKMKWWFTPHVLPLYLIFFPSGNLALYLWGAHMVSHSGIEQSRTCMSRQASRSNFSDYRHSVFSPKRCGVTLMKCCHSFSWCFDWDQKYPADGLRKAVCLHGLPCVCLTSVDLIEGSQ